MRPIHIDGDKKRLLSAIGLTAFLYAACGATLALHASWDAGSRSPEPNRRPPLRLTLTGAPLPGAPIPPAPSTAASNAPAQPALQEESSRTGVPAADIVVSDQGAPGEAVAVGTGLESAVPGSGEEAFLGWLDDSIRTGLSYPERARRREIEGTVLLSLTVSQDGATCVVSVSRGSGSRVLDQDALRFVKSLFPSPIAPGKEFTTPLKIQYLLKKR